MLHLICGTKGVGKDTFYRAVVGSLTPDDPATTQWLVYARGSTKPEYYNPIRVSFADAVKCQVYTDLGLTGDLASYEKDKDQPNLAGGKSLRDHCIAVAQAAKTTDLNHWCRLALKPYLETKTEIMITDWRFQHEVAWVRDHFAKVQTTRLFRPEVKIPEASNVTEHDLDTYLTDYLLVPNESAFKTAVGLYPQYHDYIPLGVLKLKA